MFLFLLSYPLSLLILGSLLININILLLFIDFLRFKNILKLSLFCLLIKISLLIFHIILIVSLLIINPHVKLIIHFDLILQKLLEECFLFSYLISIKQHRHVFLDKLKLQLFYSTNFHSQICIFELMPRLNDLLVFYKL